MEIDSSPTDIVPCEDRTRDLVNPIFVSGTCFSSASRFHAVDPGSNPGGEVLLAALALDIRLGGPVPDV